MTRVISRECSLLFDIFKVVKLYKNTAGAQHGYDTLPALLVRLKRMILSIFRVVFRCVEVCIVICLWCDIPQFSSSCSVVVTIQLQWRSPSVTFTATKNKKQCTGYFSEHCSRLIKHLIWLTDRLVYYLRSYVGT